MKLHALMLGKKAEKQVDIAIANHTIVALLVPLTASEESEAIEFAIAHAKKHGIEKPAPGDPLYDIGLMAKTVELGVLDADSPPEKRESISAGGVEDVLALDRDTIAYLFTLQQKHQQETSIARHEMTQEELVASIREFTLDRGDELFFSLSPSMQWSCMHFMASLLVDLLALKSGRSSSSVETATSSATSSGDGA